tara:strand:+ start:9339 stop:10730 length:1392 start_codon:yes stop_codon:yes gene_type:complete
MKDKKLSLIKRIEKLKETVTNGETQTLKWRIEQINKIYYLVDKHKSDIVKTLFLDLGKSKIEALSEILLVQEEISLIRRKLKSWMRPNIIKTPYYLFPSFSKVINEPLGCVLVLGPYNYPLLYIFKPLANIFSAGNTAIIKPSEKCPHTSKLIKQLVENYFQESILFAVEGDYKVSQKLVNYNFDHIFFTGSTKTGKAIMKQAAKNLIPVTLELSGTNPLILLKNANLKIAAKRIVWGKFFNAGQSCVAPNHILIDKSIEDRFIEELKNTIVEFYGENPIKSSDLSKLEKNQFAKTLEILKNPKINKKVIFGGTYSKQELKISPTLLKIRSYEDYLVNNELFSSLLPIISFNEYKEVVEIIQKNSKPLVIYIFGGNGKIHNHISQITSSGSICINDILLPVLIPDLPFGGVGNSGIGKFHGEAGFKNFSNQKSFTRKNNFLDINLRYPPYENIFKFIKIIFKI